MLGAQPPKKARLQQSVFLKAAIDPERLAKHREESLCDAQRDLNLSHFYMSYNLLHEFTTTQHL